MSEKRAKEIRRSINRGRRQKERLRNRTKVHTELIGWQNVNAHSASTFYRQELPWG